MSNKHPALTPENLVALESQSIYQAQRTLMEASDQSLPDTFQLNNDSVLYGAHPQFAVDFDIENREHRAALRLLIDGSADTVVVTAGLMNATGMDGTLSYAAAQQSNHTKIYPETGKMMKGADGKWVKPEAFQDPDFDYVIDETMRRRQRYAELQSA